ncbi:hypothetical protein [Amycolatopsis plumensis]
MPSRSAVGCCRRLVGGVVVLRGGSRTVNAMVITPSSESVPAGYGA